MIQVTTPAMFDPNTQTVHSEQILEPDTSAQLRFARILPSILFRNEKEFRLSQRELRKPCGYDKPITD